MAMTVTGTGKQRSSMWRLLVALGMTVSTVAMSVAVASAVVAPVVQASVAGLAADSVPETASPDSAAHSTLSVRALSNYHLLVAALQEVVIQQPNVGGPQTFYITPYSPDEMVAYLVWPQQKRLWIVPVSEHPDYAWQQLILSSSGMLIELDSSVVDTQEEIGTSTYLVDKPWAAEKLFDAIVEGEAIVVSPPIKD
ncbi:hypothetical protein L4C36_00960 [Photobacterium japonica]|uniref:hypothetical protein n=1 Tax=Photobacterium japonica TaxID=2910235 RepID=UPI003D13C8E6